MRSPAQALGNGVLQIRHRRVLASGLGSVSGFLYMCLVMGGDGNTAQGSNDKYGIGEEFFQAEESLR
jgi:hypothetical protein